MHGEINAAFDSIGEVNNSEKRSVNCLSGKYDLTQFEVKNEVDPENLAASRGQWGKSVEFLMSCIAMSVGLGNIWRFPFTAYENGGGAFLIPYIIVLLLIGRPLYYLEMALGQFTSKSNIQVYSRMAPAFKGVGYGQIFATMCVATYYCSLMAITLNYLFKSFAATLPWSNCDPAWVEENCYDSGLNGINRNATNRTSSSELYFFKTVLKEIPDIENGIGVPDWQLTIYLLLAWIIVFFIACKGVHSSGKASYFLAIFPYVVMLTLLGRASTLPGAVDGIIFFIKPQWDKLLMPQVWYAAVTQAFFSLNVCFGCITMYASYNKFDHNVNRDAMIVTTLDTFTSLLAGATIFGILGNLAFESKLEIQDVVSGGTGLAFISYPDAIAKFSFGSQFFSVLFFLMLLILGIGSLIALQNNIISVIMDEFRSLKHWQVAAGTCAAGFLTGLIYVTPGGQYMLTLVDFFGGTFTVYILAIFELICISWVYGLNNFCNDIEFMLKIKVNVYWKLCWGIFSPLLLIGILLYSLATIQLPKYKGIEFPTSALTCGFILSVFAIIQIPIWAFYVYQKSNKDTKFSDLFKPSSEWGPLNSQDRKEWSEFKEQKHRAEMERFNENEQQLKRILRNLFQNKY